VRENQEYLRAETLRTQGFRVETKVYKKSKYTSSNNREVLQNPRKVQDFAGQSTVHNYNQGQEWQVLN
jgi:hypothetical protein